MSKLIKKDNTLTEVERHPVLNYDLNAPLPFFLTDDILFPHYEIKNKNYGVGNPMEHIESVLADFLNSHTIYNPNAVGDVDPYHFPQIDEVHFVKTYLPCFYFMENESEVSVSASWINNVAGTPTNPVNVTRGGKVIYRVPPIMARLKTMGGKDRQIALGVLAKQAEAQIGRLPAQRERYINEFVGMLYAPKNGDGKNDKKSMMDLELKYLFTMDEIFTYYGYDTILTPELMQIKPQVLGKESHAQPSGPVPTTVTPPTVDTVGDDDSDLW